MNKKHNNLGLKLLLPSFLLLGVVACDTGSSQGGGSSQGPQQSGNLDEGLVSNIQAPKSYVASKADNRSNAYSAKQADGTLIGNYKTVAEAINAAVDFDADQYNDFDSIVTKMGDDFVLFHNKPGFASNNDDQFWYFENGTSLDAYNCWDQVESTIMLRNTSYITEKICYYGEQSLQDWNSYTMLDGFGEEFTDTTYAQYYELSTTMDAAVIAFTARRSGITKLHYEIDLTDVKIAPSYDGCEKTYAFIGFYAWQDYYVIANGIACDTSTGNWYQFIGTSRDNSFNDVQYNLGDCVLTSTYNERGGYFAPDSTKLTMDICTKIEHDDEFDEDYQVDYLSIEAEGAGKFERNITDATANEYFKTYLGMENSYVFIAGLDIKGEDESEGARCKDYFNGSYFTGLKVTEATAYVPTVEEIDNATYGFSIKSDWRGKYHDVLLANIDDTEGIIDYTLLNTGLCAKYEAVNGCDVYNFSYAGRSSSNETMGSNLKYYQSVIDALNSQTREDLIRDQTTLNQVANWYADETAIPQKFRNIINWQPYLDAVERLGSVSLTQAAKDVINAIKALEVTDYEAFAVIYEGAFAALTSDEQTIVKLSIGATDFENRLSLYNFYKQLQGVTAKLTLYNEFVYVKGDGIQGGTKEWDAEDTFGELLEILEMICAGTKWSGINDDPNNPGSTTMDGDNTFWPSLRATVIENFYRENGLTFPAYIQQLNTICEADEFLNGFYNPIYKTAALALRIKSQHLTAINQLTDDEIAFLNEVWTANYEISDLIEYNWNKEDAGRFETWYSYRTKGITVLAGGDVNTKTYQYFDDLGAFLVGCGYTLKSNGWGVTALTIRK